MKHLFYIARHEQGRRVYIFKRHMHHGLDGIILIILGIVLVVHDFHDWPFWPERL